MRRITWKRTDDNVATALDARVILSNTHLMRTTEIITISLPPDMLYLFEAVRMKESRTRSELVREALRHYFEHRFPTVKPTKEEIKILRQGRIDFKRGDYITFEQLKRELAADRLKARKKRSQKNSSR